MTGKDSSSKTGTNPLISLNRWLASLDFLIGTTYWSTSLARSTPGLVSESTSQLCDEVSCRDPWGSYAPADFATWSCVVESPRVPSGIRCTGRQQLSGVSRFSVCSLRCHIFVALISWGSRIWASLCMHTLQSHHLCFLYAFAGQFIVTTSRKASHQFNPTTSP